MSETQRQIWTSWSMPTSILLIALCGFTECSADDSSQGKPKRLAILGFEDLGPSIELSILRDALTESLINDLYQLEGIQIVERSRVDAYVDETQLSAAGLVNSEKSQLAGKSLGADLFLTGTFSGNGNQIEVELIVRAPAGAKPLLQVKERGAASAVLSLEGKLVNHVMQSLSAKQRRESDEVETKDRSPSVALLPFRNLSASARLDRFESGLTELLEAYLVEIPGVDLVERRKLKSILDEQHLTTSSLVSEKDRVRVGQLAGAERLITGSMIEVNDSIRLDGRVILTESGAIVSAETMTVKLDDLPNAVEQLARRLGRTLQIKVPDNLTKPPQVEQMVRQVELAKQLYDAHREAQFGRYPQAAARYQQVLRVDPENLDAHLGRVQALRGQEDFQALLVAAEQSARLPVSRERRWIHWYFVTAQADSLTQLKRYGESVKVCAQALAATDVNTDPSSRSLLSRYEIAIRQLGRNEEAIPFYERYLASCEAMGDYRAYAAGLWSLHDICAYHGDPNMVGSIVPSPEKSTMFANNARDTLIKLIELGEKHPEAMAGMSFSIPHRITSLYSVDRTRTKKSLLTEKEQIELLNRTIRVFPNDVDTVWSARYRRACLLDKQNELDGALRDYEWAATNWQYPRRMGLPSMFDSLTFVAPSTTDDDILDAAYRVADITARDKDPSEKLRLYKGFLNDYGIVHHRVFDLLEKLNTLKGGVAFEKPAILVIGGQDYAVHSWKQFLQSENISVHGAYLADLSAAELSPYSLVVLAIQGHRVFTPDEILAFRSFVSNGGSLLVIVTPGWDQGVPGIYAPLISVFNVQIGKNLGLWTHGKVVKPHSITKGIASASAKHAVALNADPDSILIQNKDQAVLVAKEEGKGRVVVASFAQWLLPSTEWLGKKIPRSGYGNPAAVPDYQLPIERGKKVESELLRQVIGWLLEERASSEDRNERQQFNAAQEVALRMAFGQSNRDELMRAMDQLIKQTSGTSSEREALWQASEAFSPFRYYILRERIGQRNVLHGYPDGRTFGMPVMGYYDRLVRAVNDTSPIFPYAQWARAEAMRRELTRAPVSSYTGEPTSEVVPVPNAIPYYEEIRAPDKSFVWAWKRLRIGELLLISERYEEASVPLREVSDSMGIGPEKSLSTLHLAMCRQALGERDEAKRLYQACLTMPDLAWRQGGSQRPWAPIDGFSNSYSMKSTRQLAQELLAKIDTPIPPHPFTHRQ